jgi:hypothetical protein
MRRKTRGPLAGKKQLGFVNRDGGENGKQPATNKKKLNKNVEEGCGNAKEQATEDDHCNVHRYQLVFDSPPMMYWEREHQTGSAREAGSPDELLSLINMEHSRALNRLLLFRSKSWKSSCTCSNWTRGFYFFTSGQ